MQLTSFIQDLLEKGQVTVAGQLIPFGEEDIQQSLILLRQYYEEDKLEMPLAAPEFSSEAALWGARYLYHATQFAMLRDLGEEQVKAYLTDFPGPVTPEAMYAADLALRYLPDLLHLAKGLAPDDVLVACLKHTLVQWPFSSVGQEGIGEVNQEAVLAHPSLKYAYIDRIIKYKDIKRANHTQVAALIGEALGGHVQKLWPQFDNKKN
jgi:hypothetical protein